MPTPKNLLSENGIKLSDIGSIALFKYSGEEELGSVFHPLGRISVSDKILNENLPFEKEKEIIISCEIDNQQYGEAHVNIFTNSAELTIKPHNEKKVYRITTDS